MIGFTPSFITSARTHSCLLARSKNFVVEGTAVVQTCASILKRLYPRSSTQNISICRCECRLYVVPLGDLYGLLVVHRPRLSMSSPVAVVVVRRRPMHSGDMMVAPWTYISHADLASCIVEALSIDRNSTQLPTSLRNTTSTSSHRARSCPSLQPLSNNRRLDNSP